MIKELENKYKALEAEMLSLPAYKVAKRTYLVYQMQQTYRQIKTEKKKLTEIV